MSRKTLVIGFGYKARQGKDTAATAILNARAHKYEIRAYAFAQPLRQEVDGAAFSMFVKHFPGSPFDAPIAMRLLCEWAGVQYDIIAPIDAQHPWGKQRALLQWWGTEYRRQQDPDYWVNRLAARIEEEQPQIALITDVRFMNEFAYVKTNGYAVKVVRPGTEIKGAPSQHTSEIILDAIKGTEWDCTLTNFEGEASALERRAILMFDQIAAKTLAR